MLGFREVKHHYNKPTETFGCELLDWSERRIVLKYVSEHAWVHRGLDMTFPPATTTIGTYWRGRGYVVWQMYGPDGALLGYYVHIVEPVTIAADAVEYRDALVDIWFWPNGRHRVVDEDELEACVATGQMSRERARYVHEQKAHVLMTWERIVESLPDYSPAAAPDAGDGSDAPPRVP